MGTWATGAQLWFQTRADRAREEHEHWLSVSPEARAALEKQYMLGRQNHESQKNPRTSQDTS
eukprot:3064256-Amphidinium_carterae.1